MFHTLGAVKNAIGIGEGEPQLRVETERRLVNNCHRIIVATEKEKKDIVLYYDASPQTISVIPCGVNRELFRPADREKARRQLGIDGERKNILFVGRIEPLKGIDKLLMAVARLKDKRGITLLIIGGDENSQHEMERLKRLSGELRMQESVSFLGLVKQDRLPLFYNAADACVIPSYYESFGLVALESLACGTPVVTTRVGGAESVVRQVEAGYVVADNTPRRLAEKIELLLSRPGNNAGSARLMRAVTTEFSWSVIAAALVREYRSVLADYFARKTSPPPSRTRDCVTTL
jgi:D-inositol-3-phosphate glycosyltransferase